MIYLWMRALFVAFYKMEKARDKLDVFLQVFEEVAQ